MGTWIETKGDAKMLRIFAVVALVSLTGYFAVSSGYCHKAWQMDYKEQMAYWENSSYPVPGKSTDGPTGPHTDGLPPSLIHLLSSQK